MRRDRRSKRVASVRRTGVRVLGEKAKPGLENTGIGNRSFAKDKITLVAVTTAEQNTTLTCDFHLESRLPIWTTFTGYPVIVAEVLMMVLMTSTPSRTAPNKYLQIEPPRVTHLRR
jgi:hypothetical protein